MANINRVTRRNGRLETEVPPFLIKTAQQLTRWAYAGSVAYQDLNGIITSEIHLSWRGGAGVSESVFKDAIPKDHHFMSFRCDVRPAQSGTMATVWVRTLPVNP